MNQTNIINQLPQMLSGYPLNQALSYLPRYNPLIRESDATTRLMALSDLYNIYIPTPMSTEIYSKLYLALVRSLQKKESKLAISQRYENHKALKGQDYTGIIGGSDSFTIIAPSGIGKSTAISHAISLMDGHKIIEIENPYTKLVPVVVVQCPFDSSVKGMLLEILRRVDEALETNYYINAIKARATTDMLIGSVSQVCLNHIGLLIVDEIQNVVNSKNGKSLIGSLTQLINNSGISIGMIGTPESAPFFMKAMQLARRSLGLQYDVLPYDDVFINICKTLFDYQYTKEITPFTEGVCQWLYEHSGGILSVVVSLLHDAQEIAILNGTETLTLLSLNEAYQNRLSLLHDYIQPVVTYKKKPKKKETKNPILPVCDTTDLTTDESLLITELVAYAKERQIDVVDVLRDHITIEEVSLL